MFVSKLTKDDVVLITKIILEHVEKDKTQICKWLENTKISFGNDCFYCNFGCDASCKFWIHFYDYKIKASFLYTKEEQDAFNLIYKKLMYKKFGQKYIDEMRKLRKEKYDREYQEKVDELDKSIAEIIK